MSKNTQGHRGPRRRELGKLQSFLNALAIEIHVHTTLAVGEGGNIDSYEEHGYHYFKIS